MNELINSLAKGLTPVRHPYLYLDWGGEENSREILVVTSATTNPFVLDNLLRSWWGPISNHLKELSELFGFLSEEIGNSHLKDRQWYAQLLEGSFLTASKDRNCHTKDIARALRLVGADHDRSTSECMPHPHWKVCRPLTAQRLKSESTTDIEGCYRSFFEVFMLETGSNFQTRESSRRAGRNMKTGVLEALRQDSERNRWNFPEHESQGSFRRIVKFRAAFRYFLYGDVPSPQSASAKFIRDIESRLEKKEFVIEPTNENLLLVIVDCVLATIRDKILSLPIRLKEVQSSSELVISTLEIPKAARSTTFKSSAAELIARHCYGLLGEFDTGILCVDGQFDSAKDLISKTNSRWVEDARAQTRSGLSGVLPVNAEGTPIIWLSDLFAFSVRELNALLREPCRTDSVRSLWTRLGHILATEPRWDSNRFGAHSIRLSHGKLEPYWKPMQDCPNCASISSAPQCPYCEPAASHKKPSPLVPRDIPMGDYLATPWPAKNGIIEIFSSDASIENG